MQLSGGLDLIFVKKEEIPPNYSSGYTMYNEYVEVVGIFVE